MESGRITRTAPSASVSTEAGHGDVAHGQRQVARPRNRPDIDGLRAVAVSPVLLFHAHVPYVTGGFVGVDVFFFISGYLITAIIHREIVEQQFSILTFYERRVRRILPAIYVLMTAVLVGAWFLFLPKDLRDTGQGVFATAVYASNFLFYAKTNYFGATALSQPLLHTWSLGVEEQFYIFFPLLLYVLLMKTGRWAIPLLLAIFGGSLLLSIVTTYDYPAENFYFPVTRAWELGLGSLLAIALQRKILAARSSELLSLLGLVLIAASIFL